jgi:hypothetical protein
MSKVSNDSYLSTGSQVVAMLTSNNAIQFIVMMRLLVFQVVVV